MKDYLKLRKEELKKRGVKGFTLMEMLIVVAIVAVLIAIAVPIFTNQLENSREATDAANIRSSYAEVVASALTNPDKSFTATVEKVQVQPGWTNPSLANRKIGGIAISEMNSKESTKIEYDKEDGSVKIDGKSAATSTVTSTDTSTETSE